MSLSQIIVLTAIVAAFVVFAAVLAWGDYRTQQSVRRDRGVKYKVAAADSAAKRADKSIATAQARWPQQSEDQLRDVA